MIFTFNENNALLGGGFGYVLWSGTRLDADFTGGLSCICESWSFTAGTIDQISFTPLVDSAAFTSGAVEISQYTADGKNSSEFTAGCSVQYGVCDC